MRVFRNILKYARSGQDASSSVVIRPLREEIMISAMAGLPKGTFSARVSSSTELRYDFP